MPRDAQEQLRSDHVESQKNEKNELRNAFGGLRGTLNCSNRLAGAKEKPEIPGHPSGGRVLRFLVRAWWANFVIKSAGQRWRPWVVIGCDYGF